MWHPSSNIDTPEMGWINGETEAERNPEEFKDAYGVYVGKINVGDFVRFLKDVITASSKIVIFDCFESFVIVLGLRAA